MKYGYIIAACIFFCVSACEQNDEIIAPVCSGNPISYDADVKAIILSSCATNSSCHGSGSTRGPGELKTYTQVFGARTSIRAAVSSGRMPRQGSLTTEEKNAIICWIEEGASNN